MKKCLHDGHENIPQKFCHRTDKSTQNTVHLCSPMLIYMCDLEALCVMWISKYLQWYTWRHLHFSHVHFFLHEKFTARNETGLSGKNDR